ncbi:MAG: HAD family hydrolase [Acidobacteriota bacterium]
MQDRPLLIFDLDGTLVDSFPAIELGLNLALAEFDLDPINLEWVHRNVGHGAKKLIGAIPSNGIPPETILNRFKQCFYEVHLENSPPLPGVNDTLLRLARNHTLAIASNKPLPWVEELLDHHAWTPLMAVIAGPETVGAFKPDPKMLEHIFEITAYGPDDALFVGDMPVDVETGINAGIPVIGVTTGASSRESLLQAGCTAVLHSVTDLPRWIGSGS